MERETEQNGSGIATKVRRGIRQRGLGFRYVRGGLKRSYCRSDKGRPTQTLAAVVGTHNDTNLPYLKRSAPRTRGNRRLPDYGLHGQSKRPLRYIQ